MQNKQIEALTLALEAMNECRFDDRWYAAKESIKEALAQPEHSASHGEPVAVVETIGGYPDESAHVAEWLVPYKSLKSGDKLYTTPPQRKPLTDERIYQMWTDEGLANSYEIYSLKEHVRRAARAIESAHGIKE